ncbi:MAG: Sialate O-acetylesterase, partial [Phycisphaerales bacterium]|nr:Sialate O-acetylesterase [Phycisphaerales bacterium]
MTRPHHPAGPRFYPPDVARRRTAAWGVVVALLATFVAAPLRAAGVTLASPFADHMVLQRDRVVRVWGEGEPGTAVDVSVGPRAVTGRVGADGRWQVELPPLPAGGPHRLTTTSGGKTVVVDDVLCGDVWLCAGQSNMQMPLKECDDAEAVAARAGRYPTLRLCTVGKGWSATPQASAKIRWQAASPAAARDFSAVGYYFATELLADPALAGVPLAVVDASVGGTACEGWIPADALARLDPKDLSDSMFGIKPGMLYNAMIAPLGRAPIRGVVWYQGEANADRPAAYPGLLATLVGAWRERFDAPDLPFVVVQLPDFAQAGSGLHWPCIREAQAKAVAATPRASLVVGINTNDGFDLHPKRKHEVGRRAALAARRDVYAQDTIARGPVFKRAAVDGAAVRVTFDTGGDGLAAAGGIRGFAVAGPDGLYRYAAAEIDGDSVVLRSDRVPSPRTVRYAWAGVPDATLTNRSGLPAAPFRTDDLPAPDVEVQRRPAARRVATPGYEVTVAGDGQVTSFCVRGKQFLSNAPGAAGGTSIPAMFGARVLSDVRELGPDLLSCGDGQVTLLMAFGPDATDWTLTNRGKDVAAFRIALSPLVAVSGGTGGQPITLARGKSELRVSGAEAVA